MERLDSANNGGGQQPRQPIVQRAFQYGPDLSNLRGLPSLAPETDYRKRAKRALRKWDSKSCTKGFVTQ